ncbi:MAG: hypothetical protein ACFFBD_10145 [Candidatus Hodarchaeota archaeon]
MPYENSHACAINLSLEVVGSQKRKHNGKSYTVRIGKTKTGSAERSYLYPVEEWTEAEARKHCIGHGGKFEPATKKVKEYINPKDNPMIKTEED